MFNKLFKSLKWSLSGLYYCFKAEQSFQLEVGLLIATCFLGFFLKISLVHFLILTGLVILMMALELINSAIEKLADLISTDYNPVIKYIKDAGSAAVFLCLIFYCMVWLYIYVS
jgi:diacylglycerol kinase (ATP)